MKEPALPANEADRIEALRSLGLLDTPPEERFDRVTRAAMRAFNVPIALVTLVDMNRQWFKSCIGLDVSETPRTVSFCGHTILSNKPLIIEDALEDQRFRDNPLVTGEPHIRFYAGQSITARNGYNVGSLCIIDQKPRRLKPFQVRHLQDLAAWAESELNGVGAEQAVRLQLEARSSRALVESIVENTDDAVIGLDTEGKVTTWNGGAIGLFGYPKEQALRMPISRLVPEDLKDQEAHILERVLRGETVERLETSRTKRDGTRVEISISTSALRDTNGSVIGVSQIAHDITDRKAAEQALQEQLLRTARAQTISRSILDSTSETMVLIDPDLSVVAINSRFSKLFFAGKPPEVVGRRMDEFMGEINQIFADPQLFVGFVVESLADSKNRVALTVKQQWPETRELEVESVPVSTDAGAFLGRLLIFRDVTRERELDRLKSQLVAMVSHELRTPLSSIKGYAELLLEEQDVDQETQKEFLSVINLESDRLTQLVNDFLNLAKIEAGSMAWRDQEVEVPEVVESVRRALEPQLRARSQTLHTSFASEMPSVRYDRDRLTQVLINLLSNAIKFSPKKGALRVIVDVQSDSPGLEEPMARVQVVDSGVGISESDQARIFQRFVQVSDSRAKRQRGTGLGLVISKEIVEHYGGRIWVDSSPGKGSTFSFTLPLAQAQSRSGSKG